VCQWRIEEMLPTTGLDLPHLVSLAFRPVVEDHPASDSKPTAFAIPQFKNYTAVKETFA